MARASAKGRVTVPPGRLPNKPPPGDDRTAAAIVLAPIVAQLEREGSDAGPILRAVGLARSDLTDHELRISESVRLSVWPEGVGNRSRRPSRINLYRRADQLLSLAQGLEQGILARSICCRAARIMLYRLCRATTRANPCRITTNAYIPIVGETNMKWISIALVSVLAACGTTNPQPKTAATSIASPRASLASYHTFSFGLSDQPKSGYEVTPRSLEVQRRLRSVVLTALQQRGYTASDATGDMVVKLATGTGAEVVEGGAERATPTGLANGYIGVNIYDGSTGTEVWQGSAFAEIDPAKIDDSLLQVGVSHMLQDFPARDTGGVAAAH